MKEKVIKDMYSNTKASKPLAFLFGKRGHMIPKNLQIGDIFEEKDFRNTIKFKVVGFDGQGNYVSKMIEDEEPDEELPFASTDDDVEEQAEETAEEQPVVEEPKEVKATPKKKTTSKKKTTTKKK